MQRDNLSALSIRNMTNNKLIVDELFGKLEVDNSDDRKWYVTHTKYQHEKKLADWCKKQNVHYYLPMYESKHVYKNRKVTFVKPLFSGYIFIHMNHREMEEIIKPGYIANFIKVVNERFLIKELQGFLKIRESGAEMVPTKKIPQGTKVMVSSGDLIGTVGFVLNGENPNKIVITANFCRQAIEVTIENGHFQIIEE